MHTDNFSIGIERSSNAVRLGNADSTTDSNNSSNTSPDSGRRRRAGCATGPRLYGIASTSRNSSP
jgi:hypothetical protein